MDLQDRFHLSYEARTTAEYLTTPSAYGGAVAWHAAPCITVYGTPVWIFPNGKCRVGDPNAPLVSRADAVYSIRQRLSIR